MDPELVEFDKFVVELGIEKLSLEVYDFVGSGRGLRSTQSIKKGSAILTLPPSSFLNTSYVKTTLVNFKLEIKNQEPHQLLIFYLMLLKLNPKGKFKKYLFGLPKSFPVYEKLKSFQVKGERKLYEYLLPYGKRKYLELERRVEKDFQTVVQLFKINQLQLKDYLYPVKIPDIDSLNFYQLFEWSWFCVNSRSLHLDSSNLALVPFFDMFNHSSTSKVDKRSNRDGSLTFYATEDYDINSQVYINYGPHTNLTLLLEYHFIQLENHYDTLDVTHFLWEHLIPKLKLNCKHNIYSQLEPYLSTYPQIQVLNTYNLIDDLKLNLDGSYCYRTINLLRLFHLPCYQQNAYQNPVQNETKYLELWSWVWNGTWNNLTIVDAQVQTSLKNISENFLQEVLPTKVELELNSTVDSTIQLVRDMLHTTQRILISSKAVDSLNK